MPYKAEYPGVIHFEQRGHVAYLTFDHPPTLNALNVNTFRSINEIFDEIKHDEDIWGVILTGAGKSFVAGADLSDPSINDPARMTTAYRREQRLYVHETLDKIYQCPRPTIAAINGFALGGGAELAFSCDFRYASTKAKIGFPESRLGGMPTYTGPTRALRVIGPTATKEMIFTGKHYTAAEALDMRIVSKVVEPEQLMPACEELMGMILERAPYSVKYGKVMVHRSMEMSIDASLECERLISCLLSTTEDQAEGFSAFVQKRTPTFKNR